MFVPPRIPKKIKPRMKTRRAPSNFLGAKLRGERNRYYLENIFTTSRCFLRAFFVLFLTACLKCHGTRLVTALPPGVRRRLRPAGSTQIIPGLCPSFGLSPSVFLAKGPTKGVAPDVKGGTLRRGTAAAAHPAAKP